MLPNLLYTGEYVFQIVKFHSVKLPTCTFQSVSGGTSLVCHMLLLLVLGDLNAVLVLERFNMRKLGV